jgi:hypothetical protein
MMSSLRRRSIVQPAWKQHVRKKEGSLAQRLKSAYNLHFRPGSSSLFLDKDSRTHANPI